MNKPARRLRFEDAMQRLDAIVAALEAGEIGVEESITKYEEAMALAAHCRQILDQAEQRIRKIQLDAAGRPEAVPFQPPATTETGEGDTDAPPTLNMGDDEDVP
jgi:exodeoxyribonuclease VII small subunit